MKKKIIIVLVLCLILFAILLVILFKSPSIEAMRGLDILNAQEGMDESMLLPQKMYLVISSYKGELSNEALFKNYNNIAEGLLPQYYQQTKGKSIQDIIEYYKKNAGVIKVKTGIKNSEDFMKLMNSITSLQGDTLELESYRVDADTITTNAEQTQSILYLKYKDNEEIGVKVTIRSIKNKNITSVLLEAK